MTMTTTAGTNPVCVPLPDQIFATPTVDADRLAALTSDEMIPLAIRAWIRFSAELHQRNLDLQHQLDCVVTAHQLIEPTADAKEFARGIFVIIFGHRAVMESNEFDGLVNFIAAIIETREQRRRNKAKQ